MLERGKLISLPRDYIFSCHKLDQRDVFILTASAVFANSELITKQIVNIFYFEYLEENILNFKPVKRND